MRTDRWNEGKRMFFIAVVVSQIVSISCNETSPGTVTEKRKKEAPWLFQVLYIVFSKYAWMLPVGIGIPGNVLTLMISTLKHNRKLSPCIYMGAMSVADSFVLFSYGYFCLLWNFFRSELLYWEFVHKFSMYLDNAFGIMSGFLLAFMSVDRLIAVRYPMHAPRLCTTSRAKKIVIIITLLTTLLNIYSFFTYEYAGAVGVLYLSVEEYPEIEALVSGFQLAFGTVCPFIMIFSSNVLIIVSLRQAASQRRKLDQTGQETPGKENFLTRMLIFLSLAYVVTSLPLRLFYILMITPEIASQYDKNDPYWNMLYNVMLFALYFVWYCNFAINFYLYCLGGGRRYRQDAAQVLRCIFGKCMPKRELGMTSATSTGR